MDGGLLGCKPPASTRRSKQKSRTYPTQENLLGNRWKLLYKEPKKGRLCCAS